MATEQSISRSRDKAQSGEQLSAALRLHAYLAGAHGTAALVGPDPGIRFNYRIGRFVKSMLRSLPWQDRLAYIQAQGYWVLGNWELFARTHDEKFRTIAVDCSQFIVAKQRDDGAWDYPNPEWKGRIATTEGNWGSLALLETFRRTGDDVFLEAVKKWHRYLIETTGFQRAGDELAVNYFSHTRRARVCNNSVTTLRFLMELASVTSDSTYATHCAGLLAFLKNAQQASGEFPYTLPGEQPTQIPHFQCFQYNAFECLNLMRYYELSRDPSLVEMMSRLLGFLRTGQAADGHIYYQCGQRSREVTYHTAAAAAAFANAADLGIDGYAEAAARGYAYLLHLQRPDGSFPHSRREHYILSDQRAYPRYLAMIQYHLVGRHGCSGNA